MKLLPVGVVLVAALLGSSTTWAGAPDRAEQGRAIALQFGAELRAALQAAMTEDGPLAAVRVCNEDAPRIARAAAEQSGAEVGRTSTRVRNPANRPDTHEKGVLLVFEEDLAAGTNAQLPEQLDVLADGRVRYMSAIVTQPPCLACHGEQLAPPVAAAIDTLYPEDQATGYQVGELRGAFTITWPKD